MGVMQRGPVVGPTSELVAIEVASALEPIIDPGPVASPASLPGRLSLSQFDIRIFSKMHSYQQQLERQQ